MASTEPSLVANGWGRMALRERLHLVRYVRATYCGRVVRPYDLKMVGSALRRLPPWVERAVIDFVRAVP